MPIAPFNLTKVLTEHDVPTFAVLVALLAATKVLGSRSRMAAVLGGELVAGLSRKVVLGIPTSEPLSHELAELGGSGTVEEGLHTTFVRARSVAKPWSGSR